MSVSDWGLVKTGAELTLLGAIFGGRRGAAVGAVIGGVVVAEGVERGGSLKLARIISNAFPVEAAAAPPCGLDDEYFDAPPLPYFDSAFLFSSPPALSKSPLLLEVKPAPVVCSVEGLYSTDLVLNEFLAHADRHGWFEPEVSEKKFRAKARSYADAHDLEVSRLCITAKATGSPGRKSKHQVPDTTLEAARRDYEAEKLRRGGSIDDRVRLEKKWWMKLHGKYFTELDRIGVDRFRKLVYGYNLKE